MLTSQFYSTSTFTSPLGSTWTFGGLGSGANWVIVDGDGTINNEGGADGGTRPFLLMEYQTNIINSHQLQLTVLDPTANYTLGGNVDLSGTNGTLHPSDMWSPAGFVPIGNINTPFVGSFDGQGHTIANLFIDALITGPDVTTGLFGTVGDGVALNGTIANVGLVGGRPPAPTVSAYRSAVLQSGSVTNSYATTTVSGDFEVGGLVGGSGGTITQSCATGAVSGIGGSNVGGLVGFIDFGAITQSYATGAVNGVGGNSVGGLVGNNLGGTITLSYATGAVSGDVDAGGLVGYNFEGTVAQSYATGAVSGASFVGGLVGDNLSSTITQSYATGTITAASADPVGDPVEFVGGLVGYNEFESTISNSYATGAISASGIPVPGPTAEAIGGLAGENDGTVTGSYGDRGCARSNRRRRARRRQHQCRHAILRHGRRHRHLLRRRLGRQQPRRIYHPRLHPGRLCDGSGSSRRASSPAAVRGARPAA